LIVCRRLDRIRCWDILGAIPFISETNCMALHVAAKSVVNSAFSLPLNSYPYLLAMEARSSSVILMPLNGH
jgi:hypothetical protein